MVESLDSQVMLRWQRVFSQQDQLRLRRFPLTSGGVLLLEKLQMCLMLSVEQEAWQLVLLKNELALAHKTGVAFSTCTEVLFKTGDVKRSRLKR